MENYVMKEEDFAQIERIIKITKTIESLYKKLYDLEISGLKNSASFIDTINNLKMAIDIEKNLYLNFKISYLKAKSWSDYLLDSRENFDYTLEGVISLDLKNQIIRRIVLYLSNFDIDDCTDLILQKYVSKDLFNIFIYFLGEKINADECFVIKKELIQIKYAVSFMESSIENNMLLNDFTIPNAVYINSKLVADFDNIDSEYYKVLRDYYSLDVALKQVNDIFQIENRDCANKMKYIKIILKSLVFRSANVLLSDELISELYEEFEKMSGIDIYEKNSISIDLLLNLFASAENDKLIPYTLSLAKKS